MFIVQNDRVTLTQERTETLEKYLLLTCKIEDKEYVYKVTSKNIDEIQFYDGCTLVFSVKRRFLFYDDDINKLERWVEYAEYCRREVIRFLIRQEPNWVVRNRLRLSLFSFTMDDIIRVSGDTIGTRNQCGFGLGTVKPYHRIFLGYSVSKYQNKKFYTVYKIPEYVYSDISKYEDYFGSTHKYKKAPDNIKDEIVKLLSKGDVLYEGWELPENITFNG